jgi:hypothetical protein
LELLLSPRAARGRRRVEGRPTLEKIDDLSPAVAGALDDFVDPLLGRPTHLDEVRQRNPGDRRVLDERHHGVAMAAEHEGADVLHRDVELGGNEIAQPRRIENARHADHHVARQPREFLQRPDHRVERVGDADDEGLRGVFPDPGADLLHHLEIDLKQVIAAHARLTRHAGRNDANVGALDPRIGGCAGELCVEAVDRRGLSKVQRLALGNPFDDVEKHHVAEFLEGGEKGEGTADLTGADEGNSGSGHGEEILEEGIPE